jgi:hypothetical protein
MASSTHIMNFSICHNVITDFKSSYNLRLSASRAYHVKTSDSARLVRLG